MLRAFGLSFILVTTLQIVSAGQALVPNWTLAERVQEAAAVARVSVVSEPRVRAIDVTDSLVRRNPGVRGRPIVVPVTEWDVLILDASKSSGAVVAGATLAIGTRGGKAVVKDREYFADGPNFNLVRGGTYLVFVTLNEALGMAMTSEFDVFRLDGERPTAVGNGAITPYGKEIVSQERDAVLETVRQAVAP